MRSAVCKNILSCQTCINLIFKGFHQKQQICFSRRFFPLVITVQGSVVEPVKHINGRTEPPVKEEENRNDSKSPEPEWYLEQFRVHFGTIQALFQVCPPEQWEALSLALGEALNAVGKGLERKLDSPPTGEVQSWWKVAHPATAFTRGGYVTLISPGSKS
jgi:hypothetical protein